MVEVHLTDEQLQAVFFCDQATVAEVNHANTCPECRARLNGMKWIPAGPAAWHPVVWGFVTVLMAAIGVFLLTGGWDQLLRILHLR